MRRAKQMATPPDSRAPSVTPVNDHPLDDQPIVDDLTSYPFRNALGHRRANLARKEPFRPLSERF
jgi:hypothetical protein